MRSNYETNPTTALFSVGGPFLIRRRDYFRFCRGSGYYSGSCAWRVMKSLPSEGLRS
jgi:hypothetical protein